MALPAVKDNHPPCLIDPYGRKIDYLRLSITDRCNLRCLYCMPGKGIKKLLHQQILSYEELLRFVRIAHDLGVKKVRITGGEPLVRKGVSSFIKNLSENNDIEITITTNGILLGDHFDPLAEAGIKRLNISLDSLKQDRYEKITGFPFLHTVLKNIDNALAKGFSPVKVNMVVIKGINDDEVINFVKFALKKAVDVRFIEYMPVSRDGKLASIPSPEIKQRIENEFGPLIKVDSKMNNVAEIFKLESTGHTAGGRIGFISPRHDKFCLKCNRLRLTSHGFLKPCLLSENMINIGELLRMNAADEKISEVIIKAVGSKPPKNMLNECNSITSLEGNMSFIGG